MINSTSRLLRVFLCYASADLPAVRKLYYYLLRRGIDPWLDRESLLPGEYWEVEIPKALAESDAIIVCLSEKSINKEGYVQKEIAIALDKALEKPGRIFIIPAKLEECDLPMRIKKYHWVDMFRDDGHKRLMQSLNKRAAELGLVATQAAQDTKQILNNSPLITKKELEQPKPQKVSKAKEETLPNLLDLLANADNAYYAMAYDRAMRLYGQVLDLDPDNKHAQQQLRKAKINQPLESVKPEAVPIIALQFYKRSRALIAVGDLPQAKKLLKQSVDISKEAGIDFPNAQNLLKNIQNALKAEEFKKKAFEEIDTQQWAKAVGNLNSAINLDPTDDAVQTLLSHLRSLLKAQYLINNLNANSEKIKYRSATIKEIREIINITNETTALSKLWQEVVKLFGEFNHKGVSFREIVLVVLSTVVVLLSAAWLVYLFPRNYVVVDCASVISGLQAKLNYPFYIANGDKDRIEITFTNVSDKIVDGLVVIAFGGTAKVQFLAPSSHAGIEINELPPNGEVSTTIYFLLDEPFSIISDPGYYVNFTVGSCVPKDLHIAISPLYNMRKLLAFLWSTVVVLLIGLFWSQIKDWLLLVFKRNGNDFLR